MRSWIENIFSVYQTATKQDRLDGFLWYARLRNRCQVWAKEFKLPLEKVVAVYAVLSPSISWSVNDRDCYGLLKHGRQWKTSVYRINKLKALKIIGGASIDDVNKKGPKVKAFYQSILGQTDAVCIDRHAGAIAFGRTLTPKERHDLRRTLYIKIVKAYKFVADYVGLSPSILQAITWTAYRRRLAISYQEV